MAEIKVKLVFVYDTEEDISDWNIDVSDENGKPLQYVKTYDDAIKVAYSELENSKIYDFEFEIENNK